MAHKTLAIVAVLSLAGLIFLVYLAMTFEAPEGSRTVEIEQPVPRPLEPIEEPVEIPPDTGIDDEPEQERPGLVLEPLPEPEPPAEPLPPLDESDEYVLTRLAGMELGARLLRLVTPEGLVRKFVVFTDNVARGELPQLQYPLQRMEGEMPAREVDDNLYVTVPATHERFDTVVDTLVSLDVQQGMRIYEAMEPLLDEAYAELGYGERDFDTVAVRAIDRVLAADVPEGPFQLIKPSVMYQYAEGSIESLSPVEKQLIRLGPENTARLKERLRDYRRELAE